MTNPNTPLQQRAAAFQHVSQEFIGQVSSLWTEAADRSDTGEGLGINGRIALVHGLVDVWAKGYVALVEALLAGPLNGPASGSAGVSSTLLPSAPLPSQVVVPAAPYARRLDAKGPFHRVGLDNRTVPRSCIAFEPDTLNAGKTEFKIFLTDFRFVGANYNGTVVLTGETTGSPPDELVVTVGL
jgi:hypothetical protein